MVRAALSRWIYAPPVSGWHALVLGLVAVWVPSIVRLALNGVVTGCEFTPYLPFVLLCAILLRWWQAGAVALAAVAVLGGAFGGSPAFDMACFMPAAGIFLASSAVMIAVAVLVRSAVAALQRHGLDDSAGGIVFSLDKGDVWASWNGQAPPMLLGSQRKVSERMEDFLAQEEPGKGREER